MKRKTPHGLDAQARKEKTDTIDHSMILCHVCGEPASLLRDFCACGATIRVTRASSVRDAFSLITSPDIGAKLRDLRDMCQDRDAIDGAFEREEITE